MKKILIFLFFLSFYLFTMGGHFYSIDGNDVFLTTQSLIEKGELSIPRESLFSEKGREEKIYGVYGIGQTLYQIPFYLMGKLFLKDPVIQSRDWQSTFGTFFSVSASNVFAAAFLTLLFFILCKKFYTEIISFFLTFILGFGTMLFPYSKFDFSEILQGIYLISSFYSLLKFRESGRREFVLLSGFLMGLGVATRTSFIIFIFPLMIYLYYQRISFRHFLSFFILSSFGIFLNLFTNFIRFGNPFHFGEEKTLMFVHPLLAGIYGLLLSPGKGLFIYNPICIFFFVFLPSFFRKWRCEAILFSSLFAINVLFFAKWWAWGGGACWGPRFLMITLPFLIIPLGQIWEAVRNIPFNFKKWLILLFSGVFLISLWVQILGVVINDNDYITLIPPYIVYLDNDTLFPDFVPYYSRIVGHSWLLREILNLPAAGFTQFTPSQREQAKKIKLDFWFLRYWGILSLRKFIITSLIFNAFVFLSTSLSIFKIFSQKDKKEDKESSQE